MSIEPDPHVRMTFEVSSKKISVSRKLQGNSGWKREEALRQAKADYNLKVACADKTQNQNSDRFSPSLARCRRS